MVSLSYSAIETIKQRISNRTYLNIPIDAEIRSKLAAYAKSIHNGPLGGSARFELVAADENDHNTLRGLGTYGFIQNAPGFVVGATPDGDQKLEDYGYMLEMIILFATSLGLGSCWLGGTFTKSSFADKISVKDHELVPAVAAVGHIAEKPRRIDSVIRVFAKADFRLPWENLFFENEFDKPIIQMNAGDYQIPLEMVRIGPSASNRQPWRILKHGKSWHFFLYRSPGYRASSLAKIFTVADLKRMDMGIAMCHFELTASELGLSGHWIVKPPAIEYNKESLEYTVSWVPTKIRFVVEEL